MGKVSYMRCYVFIFVSLAYALMSFSCNHIDDYDNYDNLEMDTLQKGVSHTLLDTFPKELSHVFSDSFQLVPFHTFEKWRKMQGGAIYNDMLVCLTATDKTGTPNGFIYDVKSGKKICDMTFSSLLNGKEYYMPHANQVSFGKELYNEDSDFPLLYVSQVNGGSGRNDIRGERGVLVYNLEKTGQDSYEPILVQAICPDLNDELLMKKLGSYTPNYIVDTDKNRFIVIGYPNKSWYNLSGPQPISIFNIPAIEQGSEITFTNNDILDSYTLSQSLAIQQSFYYRGRVFLSCGFSKQATIRILNLVDKNIEYQKNMAIYTSGEPQFLGVWREKILYYEYDASGQIYEIIIPNYVIVQ